MTKISPLLLLLTAFFLLLNPLQAGNEWETWTGCKIVPNEYNDGDSFHIKYKKEEFIIRLYYVDTPETGTSNRGADRQVADQAAHFQKTPEEVIYLGKYAKQVTAQLLSHPFTIVTKESGALGNSKIGRIYGFVTTSDGEDLAAVLIENGLARSHGIAAAPPGKDAKKLRATYDQLEARAQKAKVGIYSPDPLRSIARAPVKIP